MTSARLCATPAQRTFPFSPKEGVAVTEQPVFISVGHSHTKSCYGKRPPLLLQPL